MPTNSNKPRPCDQVSGEPAGRACPSELRRTVTCSIDGWRAVLRPARLLFTAAVGIVAAFGLTLIAASTPGTAHVVKLQPVTTPRSVATASGSASAEMAQPIAAQPSVSEGATNAQGERLLAGADRYATAVLLASVPLDAGDAATGEVLVVSGESLVDAVSAVSVAASRDAAIVLTATDAVPQVVAEFIADRSFDRVTVGGGTAAVSEVAADELAALVNDNANDDAAGGGSVPRVAGATRFETAVAAARAAGEPGVWCDGRTAAVLVSGDSLVDGVIAAPVAYAMGLPLLFTERDALPDAVVDYLAETGITRAVVVGSTSDVSGPVLAQLGRADVAVVAFDAATPAARSVELAEAMEGCATQPVAPGEFALLDAQQPVDGVAAAAALATGLGEHSDSDALIPVLAVNQDSLPQPVADYLAKVGRRHDEITLYPLGGVARLTPRVISSAVVAAGGEPPEPTAVADADDDTDDDAGGGATAGAGRRPAGSGNPDARTPGDVGAPSGGVPGASSGSTVVGRVSGAAGGAAGLPEFAATEDLDGDGELSFDELYPADTSHRDAYLAVSGGVAPPGAFAPPVPDLAEVGGDYPRRSELTLGRTSHDRFPNGFPLPPGAPDYATTTFDERQQLRADAYATYAKPDPSSGAPLNTARGQWDDYLYALLCERQMESREFNNGRSPAGFGTFPCEWMADWSIWQCDVLNDPAVTRLAPHEQWTELTVRYYDLWVELVGRDRFHATTKEVFAPRGWLWAAQYSFRGFWEGVTYIGPPFCSFRLDNQPSKANQTFHNQQVTLLQDYFNTRTGRGDSEKAASDYIFEHLWLPRNRWYLDDVCSVDSFGCPSQTRGR